MIEVLEIESFTDIIQLDTLEHDFNFEKCTQYIPSIQILNTCSAFHTGDRGHWVALSGDGGRRIPEDGIVDDDDGEKYNNLFKLLYN